MSRDMWFFSVMRRHTRCALVTGVQTCALPILRLLADLPAYDQSGWALCAGIDAGWQGFGSGNDRASLHGRRERNPAVQQTRILRFCPAVRPRWSFLLDRRLTRYPHLSAC